MVANFCFFYQAEVRAIDLILLTSFLGTDAHANGTSGCVPGYRSMLGNRSGAYVCLRVPFALNVPTLWVWVLDVVC